MAFATSNAIPELSGYCNGRQLWAGKKAQTCFEHEPCTVQSERIKQLPRTGREILSSRALMLPLELDRSACNAPLLSLVAASHVYVQASSAYLFCAILIIFSSPSMVRVVFVKSPFRGTRSFC